MYRCGLNSCVFEPMTFITYNHVKVHITYRVHCPHKHLIGDNEHRMNGRINKILFEIQVKYITGLTLTHGQPEKICFLQAGKEGEERHNK